VLRRKLGFVDPDPAFDRDVSQHIGLIRYGNEAIDRWAACPAQSNPEQIAKSILWMEAPKV
jgi:protein SCO1